MFVAQFAHALRPGVLQHRLVAPLGKARHVVDRRHHQARRLRRRAIGGRVAVRVRIGEIAVRAGGAVPGPERQGAAQRAVEVGVRHEAHPRVGVRRQQTRVGRRHRSQSDPVGPVQAVLPGAVGRIGQRDRQTFQRPRVRVGDPVAARAGDDVADLRAGASGLVLQDRRHRHVAAVVQDRRVVDRIHRHQKRVVHRCPERIRRPDRDGRCPVCICGEGQSQSVCGLGKEVATRPELVFPTTLYVNAESAILRRPRNRGPDRCLLGQHPHRQ